MSIRNLIRTMDKDRVSPKSAPMERGTHYWLGAEVTSTHWFVVEAVIKRPEGPERRTWIAPTFEDALWLFGRTDRDSARIIAVIRTPTGNKGSVCLVVDCAYASPELGAYVFQSDNGVLMLVLEDEGVEVRGVPHELYRIYP